MNRLIRFLMLWFRDPQTLWRESLVFLQSWPPERRTRWNWVRVKTINFWRKKRDLICLIAACVTVVALVGGLFYAFYRWGGDLIIDYILVPTFSIIAWLAINCPIACLITILVLMPLLYARRKAKRKEEDRQQQLRDLRRQLDDLYKSLEDRARKVEWLEGVIGRFVTQDYVDFLLTNKSIALHSAFDALAKARRQHGQTSSQALLASETVTVAKKEFWVTYEQVKQLAHLGLSVRKEEYRAYLPEEKSSVH
jgi:hypothetical protein